jgi:hypothetical protein
MPSVGRPGHSVPHIWRRDTDRLRNTFTCKGREDVWRVWLKAEGVCQP